MWGKRSTTFQYTLYGALFGLAFPVLSTLADLYMQQLPLTLESLLQVQKSTPLHWVIDTAPFFLGLFASFAGRRQDQLIRLNERLNQRIKEHNETIRQLEMLQASLVERTEDLAQLNTQLKIVAEVARSTSSTLDLQELLSRVVTSISERFGFYHVGIFLLNPTGEWAVLQAVSSEGGRRMLARGHRLRVGEESVVGYVTGRGQPRIALDMGGDAMYFGDPDLPDTRSEIALPLQARGEIIGALDVQSREPEAFSEEDVAMLQTLADQVAMAISNARLFWQAQESLEAERKAHGELSRKAWREVLHTQPDLGQRYDPQGLLPTDGQWREEMKQAVQKGESVLSGDRPQTTLAAPIKVRDQVIGVLDAYKPEGAGEWTKDEVALLETLTDQLGVALESARLYQETQRRAARDRLMSEIADKLRRATDMDSLLRTTIQEMAAVLGTSSTFVQLSEPPGLAVGESDKEM